MSDTRNRGHRRGTEQFVVEDVILSEGTAMFTDFTNTRNLGVP